MAITIQRIEKLEKDVDKLHVRAETASRHATDALIACQDGDNPRSALLRVSSTLAQLVKDATKVSEAAQKVADAGYEPLAAPKAKKALPKGRKAKSPKAKADAPKAQRVDGSEPGTKRRAPKAKKGSKK
jgi:hypothetical protein